MNQIVIVGQQQVGDPERLVDLVLADEEVRCDDRDAPFPQRRGAREAAERRPGTGEQPRADDLCRRTVDEIPVVDEPGVRQIQPIELPPGRVGATFECLDHQHQGEQTLFVHRRREQLEDHGNAGIAALAAHRSQVRHRDADEDVTLRILAGAGLEEPLKVRAPGRRWRGAAAGCGCHRSYDSRRPEADTLIRYFAGSAQNRCRSSCREDAPP